MFPKDKCLKVVKKDGKNFVLIQMTNVISPIAVPDNLTAEIGDFDINSVADMLSIVVNGKKLPLTLDAVKKSVELWTQGTGYTLDDILYKNKAAGLTIAVGGKITLLIAYDFEGADFPNLITGPGDYEIAVDYTGEGPMSIKVKAILKDYEVDFDPSST